MKISSKVSQEQLDTAKTHYDEIFIGADLHKASIILTRVIDNSSPQAAQRFTWNTFFSFVEKQTKLSKKVHLAYEAGAFGFWPCRKLKELGINCYVVHPKRLDPGNKHVQTDRRDSGELAENLVRFVRGNNKAMTPIYIPSIQEEQDRIQSRHRRALNKRAHSAQARGRGLLLSQGIPAPSHWWAQKAWAQIEPKLSDQLKAALEDEIFFIKESQQRLKRVQKKIEAAAPAKLPLGFGRLTFVLLLREICNFNRFKNRRSVGGFSGLCGGVSASGPYHLDLSINKAGNPEMRALVIELAWRMIHYQPSYRGVQAWHKLCAGSTHVRRRKIAVVALARQLLVDIWRWQTGLKTPEELGWEMRATALN